MNSHATEIFKRSKVGEVPALDIDGELIVDSTDICHELERRFPEPSALPSDPRDRARSHALEDWTDESLYFFGLYFHWYEPTARKQAQKCFARTFVGRLAFTPYLSRVKSQLRGHISRKSPEPQTSSGVGGYSVYQATMGALSSKDNTPDAITCTGF